MTNSSANPVIGLTVVDGALDRGESCILLVVRDATTNRTHPGVISVPTVRVPREIFSALVENSDTVCSHGTTSLRRSHEAETEKTNSHDPLIFVVKMLLASKLGVADALERGAVQFKAEVTAFDSGQVLHSNLSPPAAEYVDMANLVVTITAGSDMFPPKTASYSHVLWAPLASFLMAVQRKDPALLGLDPLELCMRGLCVSTSYDRIAHAHGAEPYSRLWQRELEG